MKKLLLTKADVSKIPDLYETAESKIEDSIAYVKFFTPWSNWTWYVMEFDGENQCFGYVKGLEDELGYFSLRELEALQGPFGLRVERDASFQPKPFREI
jgi:hypothetical protein